MNNELTNIKDLAISEKRLSIDLNIFKSRVLKNYSKL